MRRVLMGVLTTLALTACQLTLNGTPLGVAETESAVTWKTVPAAVRLVEMPQGARRGQPVEFGGILTLGSSSCNKDGVMTAELDAAARTIRLSGTKKTASGTDLRCTRDLKVQTVFATVTPDAVGTYEVIVAGEDATSSAGILDVEE